MGEQFIASRGVGKYDELRTGRVVRLIDRYNVCTPSGLKGAMICTVQVKGRDKSRPYSSHF